METKAGTSQLLAQQDRGGHGDLQRWWTEQVLGEAAGAHACQRHMQQVAERDSSRARGGREEDGGRSVRQAHRPRPSRPGCPPPARRPQSLAAVACCAASPLCDWEGSAFSKGSPRSGAVHFFEHGKNRSLVEFGKMQSAPIRDARDTARAGGSVPRQGKRAGGRAPVRKASGSLRAPCQLGGKARRLRLGSRPVGAMLGGTPSEACSGGASSRRF